MRRTVLRGEVLAAADDRRERLIETAVRMLPAADLEILREAIARIENWGLGSEFLDAGEMRPHIDKIRANFRKLSRKR